MDKPKKRGLELALYAGEIMLKNGAETYRVEDTIIRICNAYNIDVVDPFVTPTGIFVSVSSSIDNSSLTLIKRINSRTIDLNKISQVNDFSRRIREQTMTFEEGFKELHRIETLPKYNKFIKPICAGMASAFFGILLGALLRDVLISFFIAIIVYLTLNQMDRLKTNVFIENAVGGCTAAIFGIVSIESNIGLSLDKIIISSIMILLPGVAITNAVRDSISGDFISGLARAAEAFIIAISIAMGVGFVLNIWIKFLGGTL